MKLLDRYLSRSILAGCLGVLLILLAIFSFIDLVQQLDDVGKGNYHTGDAFRYILFSIPARILDIAPIATLIGSIVSLGMLNKNSELTAIRASGVSIRQITLSAMKTGIFLMLTMIVLSEFIAPPIQKYAEKMRMMATSTSGNLLEGQGFWSRDGQRYLNIRQLLHGRIPSDIEIFEFDDQRRLVRYLRAAHANTDNPQHWRLQQVSISRFKAKRVTRQQMATLSWQPFPALSQLGQIELPARSLAPYNLYQYIEYQRSAGENTQRYELMLWQKVMLPFSLGALMLLALPFTFGSLRSASFGLRLVMGIVSGLIYTLANQLLGNLGLLLELNPALVAIAPVVAVIIISLLLLRRTC